ncbi:MAG: dTDP-4-dehydrorhamnose 3,5-epimerase [Hyphomonadaceae bacterium]|nr:dTDP-4-dehydrorhamnose 3,5-epimerase [Hyphomonadaceae bacterium]
MLFTKTDLNGAWLVEPEPNRDSRGWFARTFCEREFGAQGLETRFPQHSTSQNVERGTLRGMHYQRAPHGEVKLVRCLKGAIWDVIIDLNPDSPTFKRWQGFELSAENMRQLYIPKGFAHGFQTLSDDCQIGYLISEFYAPDAATGVRWDDPAFGIDWPLPITVMSDKDRGWADFVG